MDAFISNTLKKHDRALPSEFITKRITPAKKWLVKDANCYDLRYICWI